MNLQNIPTRNPEFKRIRRAFIAPENWVWLKADYKQLQLYILAQASQDPFMIKTFNTGGDLHLEGAKLLAPIIGVENPKDVRTFAKNNLSFGRVFGIHPAKFVTMATKAGFKITTAQALQLLKALDAQSPRVEAYRQEVHAYIHKHQEVRSLFGRRRMVVGFQLFNHVEREKALRELFNHIIQGCLPVKTQILTPQGWVPIGDFSCGIIWTGNEWAYAKKHPQGMARQVTVHLSDGRTFSCDDRHHLLTQTKAWPEWTHVFDLVGKPLVRDTECVWGLPLREIEDWYWCGRFVGDGYLNTQDRGLVWSLAFNTDDSASVERFKGWLDKQNLGSKRQRRDTGSPYHTTSPVGKGLTVYGLRQSGRVLWEALGFVRGWKARTKRIPSTVFTLDLPRREAFLRGYFDADGHQGPRAFKITSVNHSLLEDTLRLMQTVGQSGSIGKEQFNGQGTGWFNLQIHQKPATLLATRVEVSQVVVPMYTLAVDHDRHAFSTEGLISKNSEVDIYKLALIALHKLLSPEIRLVNLVHDEVDFLVAKPALPQAVEEIRYVMEHLDAVQDWAVQLKAEISVGPNWADLEEVS